MLTKISYNVYFDDKVFSHSKGKFVDTAEVHTYTDTVLPKNGEIRNYHEGYGRFQAYRLHQIDNTSDFIAEKIIAEVK